MLLRSVRVHSALLEQLNPRCTELWTEYPMHTVICLFTSYFIERLFLFQLRIGNHTRLVLSLLEVMMTTHMHTHTHTYTQTLKKSHVKIARNSLSILFQSSPPRTSRQREIVQCPSIHPSKSNGDHIESTEEEDDQLFGRFQDVYIV